MENQLPLSDCFDLILRYRPFMHQHMVTKWRMYDCDQREEWIADFLLTAPRIVENYNGSVSPKTYVLDRFQFFMRWKYRQRKRSPPLVFDSLLLAGSLAVEEDGNSTAMAIKLRRVLESANDPMLLIDRFLRNMTYREMGLKRNLSPERMRQKVTKEIERIQKKFCENL